MRRGKSNGRYILDSEGNPVEEPDLVKWALWYEQDGNRILARDEVGGSVVSTIFLGLDYKYLGGEGPPILWETMVFRGPKYQCRYTSRRAALAGHREAVEMLRRGQRN